MTTALILPVAGTKAGPWLSAIRQLADETSRSDPHITIRYPIQKIHRKMMSSTRKVQISSALISGCGRFYGHGGATSVIYLNCGSEELESFSYKPDYPDSVFHLTLYEGPESDFARELYDLLRKWPWRLRLQFAPPVRFQEIAVDGPVESRKRIKRFSPDALRAIRSLDGRYSSGALERLTDGERLDVIARAVDHLHDILEPFGETGPAASIRYLEAGLPTSFEPTLWRGAPIALEGAPEAEKLPSGEARRGNLVLTPPELAEEMVRQGLEEHRESEIRFGDPALGNGIFFAVLNRLTQGSPRIAAASAVEIDRSRAELAAERWRNRGLKVLVGDFLTARPEQSWNFVVANPPYVRSQDVLDSVKEFARSRIRAELGLSVSRRANLFTYFVLCCHEWLMSDATAVWLIPADFMETSYGSVLREYLGTRVQLLRLHTYDPHEFRFENVRVSPAVVVFRNAAPKPGFETLVSRGGSMGEPEEARSVLASELPPGANWRVLTSELSRARQSRPRAVRLGEIFRIRRGIATGANRFFVIDDETLAMHRLEIEALRPLLPRPRFLPLDGVIRADRDGNPKVGPRVFLIDSADDLKTLSRKAPRLAEYLRNAPDDVLRRHLVRQRRPFYKQEGRSPAELLASNMGQFSDVARQPVRFFLNLSRATVLNNYVVLYPRSPEVRSFGTATAKRLFAFLKEIDPEEFRIWGREYSGGMYKLDPKDLAQVRLRASRKMISEIFDRGVGLFDSRGAESRRLPIRDQRSMADDGHD